MPAVTIVAAWISAETGVGPSIASGNQTWSGNCALLPMAPMKSRSAIPVSVPPLTTPSGRLGEDAVLAEEVRACRRR